jgi:hypothetical protein
MVTMIGHIGKCFWYQFDFLQPAAFKQQCNGSVQGFDFHAGIEGIYKHLRAGKIVFPARLR